MYASATVFQILFVTSNVLLRYDALMERQNVRQKIIFMMDSMILFLYCCF